MKRLTDSPRKRLLREAIEMIAAERAILYRSYRVRLAGHPRYGQVVDEPQRSELRRMDRWLKKAKAAVR